MTARIVEVDGINVPFFIYGTAWKKNETSRLTRLALDTGFRGIDTANQRKHYHEAAVGEALSDAVDSGLVTREEIFLQTKFTFQAGQDDRLPYDPDAPPAEQVAQSFTSSLRNLRTDYIDSYILHGPTRRSGLQPDDWAAWRAMEALHQTGQARLIGISNIRLDQLKLLCKDANVQPSFVQNRCYASRAWDRDIREFCADQGIYYQGFSLLTANHKEVKHPIIKRIAKRYGKSVSQIIFRFALDLGMIPLTGTANPDHMRIDLEVLDFELQLNEVQLIETVHSADGL